MGKYDWQMMVAKRFAGTLHRCFPTAIDESNNCVVEAKSAIYGNLYLYHGIAAFTAHSISNSAVVLAMQQ